MITALVLATALTIPPRAAPFRRMLTSAVYLAWGLNGPIATMAAQVHQESGWRPDARSAYASGLAQFTPDTADWASRRWSDLVDDAPLEPAWALRALARYDRYLYELWPGAHPDCDRWAFTLSAYNGGAGWVTRDRRRAPDPDRWFGSVEQYSSRSPSAFKENRAYPRRILLVLQPIYRPWGLGISC